MRRNPARTSSWSSTSTVRIMAFLPRIAGIVPYTTVISLAIHFKHGIPKGLAIAHSKLQSPVAQSQLRWVVQSPLLLDTTCATRLPATRTGAGPQKPGEYRKSVSACMTGACEQRFERALHRRRTRLRFRWRSLDCDRDNAVVADVQISIRDRCDARPVRDHDQDRVRQTSPQRCKDPQFGGGVERAGCLVQQRQGRLPKEHLRQQQALQFAARKPARGAL